MATLLQLTDAIESVVQDSDYDDLKFRINDAVSAITAGIRMPDRGVTPPLNDLYASAVVPTTSSAYADLPGDYQRSIFYVVNHRGERISAPSGGDYYSFTLFLNRSFRKDLTETGQVCRVCVKGKKLYYQGIPSSPVNLTVSYYRAPVAMIDTTDVPDGIPEHLQVRLIKHYVCGEILGEGLEDGEASRGAGAQYHASKLMAALTDLCDFNGSESEPTYYASDDSGIIEY